MGVTTNHVGRRRGVKRKRWELYERRSNQDERGLLLLHFELRVEDVELKHLLPVRNLLQVLLSERDGDRVISALPAWIAAGVDDVRLELVLDGATLKRWRLKLDECVGRLEVVRWVANSHSALNVNAQDELFGSWMVVSNDWLGSDLGLVLDLDKFCELSDKHNEVELALEAVSSAIDVKTFQGLSTGFDKVVNNLHFDWK